MTKPEYFYFIIGLILFALVGLDIYWWINISSDASKTFEQVKAEYLLLFPESLRNALILTVLNIVGLSIAGLLFFKSTDIAQLKVLGWILVVLCGILVAWQVFTLM